MIISSQIIFSTSIIAITSQFYGPILLQNLGSIGRELKLLTIMVHYKMLRRKLVTSLIASIRVVNKRIVDNLAGISPRLRTLFATRCRVWSLVIHYRKHLP